MKLLLIHQMYLEKDGAGGSRFNEMTRIWSEEHGVSITVLGGMVNYASGKKENPAYKNKFLYYEKYNDFLEVWRCYVSESYNSNFIGRLWGYFSFVFSSSYAGLFKLRGKYDVILVTSPPLFVGVTAYILSVFKRIPFVFEVRDLWPESAIDTGVLTNKLIINLAYRFESFMYKNARLINVLTPAFKEKLINEKQVQIEKIIFIPNAADFLLSDRIVNTFDSEKFRTQMGWSEKFVITYVGAHGVANHLIQVIDTAELLKASYPHVHFVLIGEGMQKPMLKEEVIKRGLNNVQFIDAIPKSEVFKYILASDFGASILKKVDTFKTVYSNKTFDYMACKKPIFMLIDGVSRNLVEEAQCGIYIEPESPDSFAQAIKDILSNVSNVDTMGQNGYDFAKKYFDRNYLANEYLKELSKI